MPKALARWKPPRFVSRTPQREQAHYRSAEWQARRLRILIRDAYTCQECGTITSGQAAHVDHRRPLEDGGTDDAANLQTLCAACHGRKTVDEQRRRGYLGTH